MNRLIILVLLITFSAGRVSAQSPEEIRKIFYEAAKNPSTTDKFKSIFDKPGVSQPLIIAYIGGLKTLMANTVYNPYKKLKFFNEGKEMIEKAISQNKTEWEIHFVRFMIQCKIPSFLAYNNFDEDKKIIIQAFAKNQISDIAMKKIATYFLTNSGKLDNTELLLIK